MSFIGKPGSHTVRARVSNMLNNKKIGEMIINKHDSGGLGYKYGHV